MATKKRKSSGSKPFSEKAYFENGSARKLPIYKCLITEDWKKSGTCHIVVSRKHVTGNITAGIYLVDLLCAGVKESFYLFNLPEEALTDLEERIAEDNGVALQDCDYTLAHNVLFSAVDFAVAYHIEPGGDFFLTKMILEEDDEKIELVDIECGKNGKPLLISESMDFKTKYYLKQLETYAGEGNYEFVLEDSSWDEEEYQEEEDLSDLKKWTKEDWADFIENGPSDGAEPREEIVVYIFQKAILIPAAVARQIDIDKIIEQAEKGVTHDQITDMGYGNNPEENKTAEGIHSRLFAYRPIRKELIRLVDEIRDAMTKWPSSPIFHNYLYNAHILLKQEKEALAVLQTQTALFPDYLFAKVSLAQRLLQSDKAMEVPALFNRKFDLSSLYPQRKSFHISEFITFTTVICFYYLQIDDVVMASIYGTLLKLWVSDRIPSLTNDVFLLLDMRLFQEVLGKIASIRNDKIKKEELIALLME